MALLVVSAILFSPRGGSAHAARALVAGLRELGCRVTFVSGSRNGAETFGDARSFYHDVQAVDFAPALASAEPMRFDGPPGTAPLHPSFEDRPGAPDRVFASLDDLEYERQVRAWCRELERAGAARADVLHLHHLTPLNEAAARVAPDVPVVGQLHGTELLMLEQIEAGPPPGWTYADRWADRLRTWAGRCARLVVVPAGVERALELLGVPRERIVPLPLGVDTDVFQPRPIDRETFWRRVLVDEPRGWLPGQRPGSARYDREQARRLAQSVVLLYVGRFTAVKRLEHLIGAFGGAQFTSAAGLVLVGGHPGELEGEHPARSASRLGLSDVFLAGWYEQDELPEFYAAADAVTLASGREQFGQVLVEGMACGLPAIAVASLGPASIVEDGRSGWLVPPGDDRAFAAALAEAVNDRRERERRGQRAYEAVRERFSWASISVQLATVLARVAGEQRTERVRAESLIRL